MSAADARFRAKLAARANGTTEARTYPAAPPRALRGNTPNTIEARYRAKLEARATPKPEPKPEAKGEQRPRQPDQRPKGEARGDAKPGGGKPPEPKQG